MRRGALAQEEDSYTSIGKFRGRPPTLALLLDAEACVHSGWMSRQEAATSLFEKEKYRDDEVSVAYSLEHFLASVQLEPGLPGQGFQAADAGLATLHCPDRLSVYEGECPDMALGQRVAQALRFGMRRLQERGLGSFFTPGSGAAMPLQATALVHQAVGLALSGLGASLAAAPAVGGAGAAPAAPLNALQVQAALVEALGAHVELIEGAAAECSARGWQQALGGSKPLSPLEPARQVLRAFTQREAEDGAVLVFALGMEYLALCVLRQASQFALEAESVRVTERAVHAACAVRLAGVFQGKELQASLFYARNPQREQAMFGWALEAPPGSPDAAAGGGAGARVYAEQLFLRRRTAAQ